MTDKLTVPDVLPSAHAYVSKEGNSAGGELHIVLCDHNVDTDSVNYCLGRSIEVGDKDGESLCNQLLRMTKTQRLKVAHQCWKSAKTTSLSSADRAGSPPSPIA